MSDLNSLKNDLFSTGSSSLPPSSSSKTSTNSIPPQQSKVTNQYVKVSHPSQFLTEEDREAKRVEGSFFFEVEDFLMFCCFC